jgi:rRNA maturation protein Nop10
MLKYTISIVATLFIGCATHISKPVLPIDGHKALKNLTKNGFAMNKAEASKLDGKVVQLWGYLDYDNTYTCARNRWYFSLKSDKDSEAGESIHINTPASYDFSEIYWTIRSMEKENKKSPVLVKGILHTFESPTNFSTLINIEIDIISPNNIKFK